MYIYCVHVVSISLLCTGRPLFHLGLRLFQKHNLFVNLRLDHFKVMKFLGKSQQLLDGGKISFNHYAGLAEQCYHGENPYHNGTHATDVTQALNCLISTKEVWHVMMCTNVCNLVL